jgi:4,4'-diaponeurosporenoate glycosyltransferase
MQWIIFSLSLTLTLVGFFLLWSVPVFPKNQFNSELKVSVIIPARNEANRISPLLNSLKKQASLLHEWIVVDDHSTDATAQLAQDAGARVITAQPLPKGWFGKPWACYQGAKAANGDILMFLDADTVLLPQGIEKILSEFIIDETPLSVQPFHVMHTFYEQFSLFFNLIVMMTTALFTPLGKRINAQSFFGPCQVMLAQDYWAVDGHAVAKHAILEDIALGEALQTKTNKRIRVRGGSGAIAFRMYPEGLQSLVEGWTKNFATGASLIPSWLLTLVSLWITGMFIAFLSGIAPFMWQDQAYLIGYGVVGIITWFLARKVGNFSILTIFFYPLYLIFFVWLFIRSSRRLKTQKKVTWKGRELDL